MSFSLLSLGFLIGMRHAMEADHLAAVATLATRSRSIGDAVRHGAIWGIGHTITLFLFGSLVLALDAVMSEVLSQILELAVGVMLLVLGGDVLRRLLRERIHFHMHRHAGGTTHLHAHSHAGDDIHPVVHEHQHAKSLFPRRALLVGIMHGMAGSAALVLLTVQMVQSPITGMIYIALFGIGSIAGMMLLSVIIAVPLCYSTRNLAWLHNGLQAVVGIVTLVIGAAIIYDIGISKGLLLQL